MKKIFSTTVSVKEGGSRNILRGIIQYDTLNEVHIRLTDGSGAFNYDGYTKIIFKVLKADGTACVFSESDHVTATSPVDGLMTVILSGQATAVAGLCQSVIEIYAGNEKMTTARFNYEVFAALNTDKAVESTTEYSALQRLLSDLSALEATIESAEAQRVVAESARADLETGYVARAETAAEAAEMWAKVSQNIAGGDFVTREELEAAEVDFATKEELAAVKAGSAPAGYGLGEKGMMLGAADNIDTIKTNGWYRWPESDPPKGTFPTPFNTHMVFMRVWGNTGACYQEMVDMTNGDAHGVMCARTIYADIVYPWEWVNPQMDVGVEYRTTERHNTLPVYTKMVDAGALPNNSVKTVSIADNPTDIRYVISASAVDTTTGQILPSGVFGGTASKQVLIGGNRSGITISTNFDGSSAVSVLLTVKYTKNT